jgi:TrmH family RNA methyltransferase
MHPTDSLAHVRALQTRRPVRDSTRRFWIEGLRQFIHAADAVLTFDTIFHSRVLLKGSDVRRRIDRLVESAGVRRVAVSPEQFRSVSITERASGVGAIVRQHFSGLHRLDPREGLCWLVIESIRSPGNLGTILRTAEASGVAGVIFVGHRADPFDPRVVRASMGGIFHLKLARTTLPQLRAWAGENGVRLVGLAPRASRLWTELPFDDRPAGLFIGEERAGLSPCAAALCETAVRLPMSGKADSLNVAVATGVMLYELVRRRDLSRADF